MEQRHQQPHAQYGLAGARAGLLNRHIAVLVGGRELPFDAFSNTSRLDLFDLERDAWITDYDMDGSLTRRLGHSVVTVNDHAYVFGGERIPNGDDAEATGWNNTFFNDVHELSFTNNVLRCTAIACSPNGGDDPASDVSAMAPCARCWHASASIKYTAATDGDTTKEAHGVLVLGGNDSTGKWLGDIWLLELEARYDPSPMSGLDSMKSAVGRGKWRALTPTGASPLPLANHNAVAINDGAQVVVLGGTQAVSGSFLESVYVLDVSASTWSTIALVPSSPSDGNATKALTARCCSTAIAMILPMDEPNGKIVMHYTDAKERETEEPPQAQEVVFIYGGFSELEPAMATSSCILLDATSGVLCEVLTPNAGLTSYMNHAYVTTSDQKSLYVFGGIDPSTNQFLDTTSALHFWQPQPRLVGDDNDDDKDPLAIRTKEYDSGDVYVGQMEWCSNSQMNRHGHGKCTYQNGDVYDGEWRHDQRAGHGTMIYKNEDAYTGEWKDNLRHGVGIFQYHQEPSKQQQRVEVRHEGHWHMDHRCGSGTTSFADGSQLVAKWGEGGIVTSGKLENYDDSNGACSYEGEISNGAPHGEGSSEHHHSGETYTGHWHLGRRSGYGVATLRDGTTYRGDWKNGKRNGTGTCDYSRTRDRYTGKWVGGVRCGRGTCTYASGCMYTGDWRDDKCHGHGAYTFADGTFYEGNWTDNTFGGDGAMVFSLNEDEAQP